MNTKLLLPVLLLLSSGLSLGMKMEIDQKKEEKKFEYDPQASCPACYQEIVKVSAKDRYITSCCKEFICKKDAERLPIKAKEFFDEMKNPANVDRFIQEYGYMPHPSPIAACPFCRESPLVVEKLVLQPSSLEALPHQIKIKILENLIGGFRKPAANILALASTSQSWRDFINNPRVFLHIIDTIAKEDTRHERLDILAHLKKMPVYEKPLTQSWKLHRENQVKLNNSLFSIMSKATYLEEFQELLAQGANPNARTKFSPTTGNRSTVLIQATLWGRYDLAKALIEAGADVNAVDGIHENSALYYAVDKNHFNIAELLLKNGANVNLVNSHQATPLMAAAMALKENTAIVKLLIDYKARLDLKHFNGKTALDFAKEANKTKAIELLTQAQANLASKK